MAGTLVLAANATVLITFALDGFMRRTLSIANGSKLNIALDLATIFWALVLARTAMRVVVALPDERRDVEDQGLLAWTINERI